MFKHILIPTDGSELSEKAAESGVQLAQRLGAVVTGFHAYRRTFTVYYGELAWVDERLDAKLRENAEAAGAKYLDRLQMLAENARVEFRRALVEHDSPWRSIIDVAQDRNCDLIAMAAHGRRGLAALVLGSETNKVLTHSRIPVLVYR